MEDIEKIFNKCNTWNEESYSKFIKYLLNMQDLKYKEFHSSLVLDSKYEMIGIRLPDLRKIAKYISNTTDIEEFLKYSKNKYYEEIMLQGLVISNIKNEETFYKHFKTHISKIDNWALCDTFCNSIKIVRKYQKKYFEEAARMCLSEEEFISRTGLVMILSHFVNENNVKSILDILNSIKSDKFYVNMGEAWLVCELYIKHPKETLPFLKNNELNKFTQNKAISKIHDSYRVSNEEKEHLNKLRK